MINQQQQQSRMRQSSCFVYTYHLPYGIRRDICNILDADQSWRTLGGQFMNLDTTQLTLIGQAYMRNSSPTDELLNKLDSANIRINEFCYYLKQMNHCRALQILKPFVIGETETVRDRDNAMIPVGICSPVDTAMLSKTSTLDTPTPSFAENEPAQLMMVSNDTQGICFNELQTPYNYEYQGQWNTPELGCTTRNEGSDHPQQVMVHQQYHVEQQQQQRQTQQVPDQQPVVKCHKSIENFKESCNESTASAQTNNHKQQDPGEEIVRMACANNRKRTSISDQEVVNQLRLIMQINYNELKQASNDFSNSNILGNGGFASVYRGIWKGTDVAIKRLKCNLMDQALNELTILNSYRIDNILPIYGISIDGPEACLVYQFMANGSLEDRLSCKKGTPPLTWSQRALIGEGVAKGLFYLHTLRDKPLVHGDVKSANVLLDSQFVPKLGDFGLARQVFKGKNPQTELCTHCTVSSIHGTSVYLPPEYLRHKILSPAVDVYSYGIVLLEMATGKRAYDGKRLLIDIVEDGTRSMSIGQIGYSLKDSRLADDTESDLKIWYELLIKLGLNCAHKIKKKRLDMGQVLARFTDFRSTSDLSSINNQTNSMLSSTGSATTRTLTPDLGAVENGLNYLNPPQQSPMLAYHGNDILDADLNKFQQQFNQQNQQQLPRYKLMSNNSALMNVEEESDVQQIYPHQVNDTRLKDENQAKEKADHAAVEAMIPLLTELGVVAEQE